jgi:hypothetical protein
MLALIRYSPQAKERDHAPPQHVHDRRDHLTGGSDLGIVTSTLMIAALFTPLRRRIQNIIDRHFYRRKYDAAKVLAAFGATVQDETDLDALTDELLRVVDETMQPEFVGLWMRDTPIRARNEIDGSLPTPISVQFAVM